jgi:hypothetical protein
MSRYSTAGSVVQIRIANVYTNIAGVRSISGPTGQKTEIDVTALADTAQQFLSGIPDFGEMTLTIYDDFADAGNAQILNRFNATNVTDDFKVLLPFTGAGNTITFSGFVKSWQYSGEQNQAGSYTTAIKLSGNLTRT